MPLPALPRCLPGFLGLYGAGCSVCVWVLWGESLRFPSPQALGRMENLDLGHIGCLSYVSGYMKVWLFPPPLFTCSTTSHEVVFESSCDLQEKGAVKSAWFLTTGLQAAVEG